MSASWTALFNSRARLWLVAAAIVCCAPLLALPWPAAVIGVLFILVSLPLCRVDLALHRLPDAMVLPGAAVVLAAGALFAMTGAGWARWLIMLAMSAGFFVVLYLLALLSLSGLGFGDVKLGLLVGGALGWFGPETIVLWFVALIPAIVVSYLIERRMRPTEVRGRAARVAFGPPMLGATWLVLVVLSLWAG